MNNNWIGVRSIPSVSSGKWYFEVYIDESGTSNWVIIGAATSAAALTYPGSDTNGYGYNGNNGYKFYGGSSSSYGDSYTDDDIIGVALDLDNGEIYFAKNNVWQNNSDPAARTNPAYTGLSGIFFAMAGMYHDVEQVTSQFDSGEQTYSPPSGFTSLC